MYSKSLALIEDFSKDASSYSEIIEHKITYKLLRDNQIPIGTVNELTTDEICSLSRGELKRELVCIDNTSMGLFITVTGSQDSGKSYICRNLYIDQMIRRQGMAGMIIDPKGEYRNTPNAFIDEKAGSMWERMKIEPKYDPNVITYRPFICSSNPKKDNAYQLDLEKIRIQDLFTLLNLHVIHDSKSMNDALRSKIRRVRTAIRTYRKSIGKGGYLQVLNTRCPPANELVDFIKRTSSAKGKDTLIDEIENMLDEGIIGQEYSMPSFVSLISRGYLPALHTSLKDNLRDRMAGWIQIAIEEITDEKEEGDRLPYPVQFMIDEFNIIASKKTFSFFKNMYDQMRSLGVGLIGIAPKSSDLHETAIRQSDYWICAKPDNKELIEIKSRLSNVVDATELKNLKDPGKGKYPKEFGLITRQGIFKTFFPIRALSHVEKKKVKRRRVTFVDEEIKPKPDRLSIPEETQPEILSIEEDYEEKTIEKQEETIETPETKPKKQHKPKKSLKKKQRKSVASDIEKRRQEHINSLRGRKKEIYKALMDFEGWVSKTDLSKKTGYKETYIYVLLSRLEKMDIIKSKKLIGTREKNYKIK